MLAQGTPCMIRNHVPTSWQGFMSLSKISAWSRARGNPSTCRAREQLGLATARSSSLQPRQQQTGPAAHQELASAALDHGFTKKCNGDLQHTSS